MADNKAVERALEEIETAIQYYKWRDGVRVILETLYQQGREEAKYELMKGLLDGTVTIEGQG